MRSTVENWACPGIYEFVSVPVYGVFSTPFVSRYMSLLNPVVTCGYVNTVLYCQ